MQPETKKSNPLLIVLVVLLLIIIVGFLATKDSSAPANTTKQVTETEEKSELDSTKVADTDIMDKDNTPTPSTPTKNITEETPATEPVVDNDQDEVATAPKSPVAKPTPTKGTYQEYNATAVANSDAENIILFFHASWCPSCHALNTNITRNLDSIPAGTEIYKVDYDTSLELRKRYSVTTQHTLVKIDNQGNLLKKWDNSMTLDALVKKI